MNIQVNDVSETRKSLVITLDATEVATEQKAVLAEFTQYAQLPGFRPGKVPANLEENQTQMQELVMGGKFEPDSLQNHPSLRLETALEASRSARYYVTVSALDFEIGRAHV